MPAFVSLKSLKASFFRLSSRDEFDINYLIRNYVLHMLEGWNGIEGGGKDNERCKLEIFDENFGCRNLHKIVSVPFCLPYAFPRKL
jgi:hypothetical protein